jgi:hypothetical protein
MNDLLIFFARPASEYSATVESFTFSFLTRKYNLIFLLTQFSSTTTIEKLSQKIGTVYWNWSPQIF